MHLTDLILIVILLIILFEPRHYGGHIHTRPDPTTKPPTKRVISYDGIYFEPRSKSPDENPFIDKQKSNAEFLIETNKETQNIKGTKG